VGLPRDHLETVRHHDERKKQPRQCLEVVKRRATLFGLISRARKSAACATVKGADDAKKTPVQRSLAVRTTSGHHAHHERACQRHRYNSQEQWPAESGAQHEENRAKGQAERAEFNEESLPSLEDSKNVQFEIASHCSRVAARCLLPRFRCNIRRNGPDLPGAGHQTGTRGRVFLGANRRAELDITVRNVSGRLQVESPLKHELTQLLVAWSEGDEAALENLTPLVQQELHSLAARYIAGERPGHILQTTALVHEAYIRLIDWQSVHWQNRAHFFAMAARMMRGILVDFARNRARDKRGGGVVQVSLSEALETPKSRSTDIVALDDALKVLEKLDPRQSQVVELRFFGGLDLQETADVLRVSIGTVRRDWSLAKAWLYRELNRKG
jgi:RNA polymerase sigma factor (TIGR02999 family)